MDTSTTFDHGACMQSAKVPLKYFVLLILIFLSVIAIDVVTDGTAAILANIEGTLFVTLLILVIYTVGISLIVRKIEEEASRMTAIRIFMVILLAIGVFLAMTAWIDDPTQIVLVLGIVWGAALIAMRDLIQNMIGSLMILVTGIYRIGDRIRVRNVYGLVMDIGIFRTTLMELDSEGVDRQVGEIVTLPNGILFREMVTNTTRQISVISDEIRITLPFGADLGKAREVVNEVIRKHTAGIEQQAAQEINSLRERKFLSGFDTKPIINLQWSDYGVVLVVTYITASGNRAAVKTEIIGELSKRLPGIVDIGK